ncbi:enoyl-CoA hydratase (plasmid) [Diaphorobacter sp. HDW4B]|uniref:enoyl-CoA hydratase/isomerase family protein n=1 Tax=Diaphorobacter sp. HDW4B TaxID=2714925 RepID=UPI00140AA59C|nr:enoyl-CoA hydratase-related protein [Diaphorobacter sp. HDW4B]QIL74006.1 enoyl-CoA hydratase [Diaphorobacter sp. HDW4B]
MTTEILRTEVDEGVLVITFNRPEKLNAWTYQLHAQLRRAIEAANADKQIDAIVVTATGKGFCAGADMSAVFGLSEAEKQKARDDAQTHTWVQLLRDSKPIVAAVNGAAIGIGASLILPMDQILAAPEAKFALRFVKMGLVPELAASHFAQRRMGFGNASRLLLTGDTLSADAALAVSLIDQIVPAESLLSEAKALARRMGCNPHAALRTTKQLLTLNADETDLQLVQQRELDALTRSYASAEHKEAVAAFLEKREPDFAGARA